MEKKSLWNTTSTIILYYPNNCLSLKAWGTLFHITALLFCLYMLKKSKNRHRANCCETSVPAVFFSHHDNECWIVASEHKSGNYSWRRNQLLEQEQFCTESGAEHFWTSWEPLPEIPLQFSISTFCFLQSRTTALAILGKLFLILETT